MKWIKTSERLPKVNQTVLVWTGNYPDIMSWDGARFKSGCLVLSWDAISHWMEIESPN